MQKLLVMLALIITSASCNAQDGNTAKSSEVKMIGDKEPGKPFTLDITVLDITSRQPVKGVEVLAYQTNYKGDYETTNGVARIHGTAWSNEKGSIRLITIYPGGYNNSNSGEHIHFTVKATGYKGGFTDLMFSDYYGKMYDFKNPVVNKVYLESLEEKNGKMTGKALLYIKK